MMGAVIMPSVAMIPPRHPRRRKPIIMAVFTAITPGTDWASA